MYVFCIFISSSLPGTVHSMYALNNSAEGSSYVFSSCSLRRNVRDSGESKSPDKIKSKPVTFLFLKESSFNRGGRIHEPMIILIQLLYQSLPTGTCSS